ncbi:MAG: DoxX family protein [Flavobacteriaceae bacterium]|nr:DoxX family protein [Flavobacteriaceae bacterium]
MNYIPLIGRILFSIIFLMSPLWHFSKRTIELATSKGIPSASFLVPAAGIMAFIGALSIILGYQAKIGSLIIIAFLIPATLMMHDFWTITDPGMQQLQKAMFMKNLALMGAALLISYFGSGPFSLR